MLCEVYDGDVIITPHYYVIIHAFSFASSIIIFAFIDIIAFVIFSRHDARHI